jgi:LEA14-like dessication related protein
MIFDELSKPSYFAANNISKMRFSFQAGIIVILFFSTVGCGKPQSLQYLNVQNFNVVSFGLGSSVITADVKFYNPNNFRMKLKRAEMDISVNDKYVGKSTLDTLMIIPKNDSFYIPVRLSVDIKTLLSNSLNSLFSNEINLKMEGKARLGKGGFFFNFPFSYQGKQKFKLF